MATPIAWLNLKHRKRRTAAALTGVALAIVLIFLQVGLYRGAHRSAVMVLDQFSFDLALISKEYVYFRQPGAVPRARLEQAMSVAGVAQAAPLGIGVAYAQVPGVDAKREVAVLGIDPRNHVWNVSQAQALARSLSVLDSVILDTRVGPGFDRLGSGLAVELSGRRVTIDDTYAQGPGFAGGALLVAGEQTFDRIFGPAGAGSAMLGLIRTAPGADPARIRDGLNAALPRDVRAVTRAELEQRDQRWTLDVKPVGIMLGSGLILSFVIGAVILYQIIAAEIVNYLREYATLSALGCSAQALNLLAWRQAILYTVIGFVPAACASTLIYLFIQGATSFPAQMTPEKLLAVFVAVALMCVVAGTAAMRKVSRADPAELF